MNNNYQKFYEQKTDDELNELQKITAERLQSIRDEIQKRLIK